MALYEERVAYAPLILFEYDHDPGMYSLVLSDNHMVGVDGPFQAAGHEGGGYDWAGVARQIQQREQPALAGRFGMDPEAGMFVAFGEDLEALQALAAELHAAFHDPERLTKLIAGADPGWFD